MERLEESIVTIGVKFKPYGGEYTYIAHSGHGLSVGDNALVPTDTQYHIVTVTRIDDKLNLPNTDAKWKWIYCGLGKLPHVSRLRF